MTIGLAFVDEMTDPRGAQTNLAGNATDFYDKTAPFTMGVNAGCSPDNAPLGIFGQMGLRRVGGMSEFAASPAPVSRPQRQQRAVDVPFLVGVRARF